MFDEHHLKRATLPATTAMLKRLVLGSVALLFATSCQNDGHQNLAGPTLKGLAHIPSYSVSTTTESGASFTTDKDDYSPGETVNLLGTGWVPADVLDIHLDVTPPNHPPVDWTITVDDDGNFTDGTYEVQESDAGATLTITATSRATGEWATATFTDNGAGSPTNCLTSGVTGAFTVDDNATGDGNPAAGNVTVSAPAGSTITKICIKDGSSSFALGGSGGDANSQGGGDNGGTSSHSIPITADGSGGDHARYGLDLEPGDAQDGCYTVSGMGTGTVTVTRAPSVGGTPNCKNVSHIDVFTTPGGQDVGVLQACKYKDLNADGDNDAEPALSGWSMTISPVDGAPESATQSTDGRGCVSWTNLTPGSYTVTEAAPGGGTPWFNTDPGSSGPCLLSGTSSVGFSACPAAPNKTDNVTADNTTVIEFGNLQSAEKSGVKFYDADVDGVNNDGLYVNGWKITLSGTAVDNSSVGPANQSTAGSGAYSFIGLLPSLRPGNNYTVAEGTPSQASWIHTTPTSIAFTLTAGERETGNDFGNVCVGAGGGKTLGFWSNNNGRNQMNDGGTSAPELALLSGLNLRNADGSNFDPATYAAFRTWLLSATATNMAYMLSAQLAAMKLNVEAGFVSGSALVYAPGCGNTGVGNNFISINDLMAAADAALGADGYTPSGDPNRATQECLKNALDRANNNLNFVQSNPANCPTPTF